MRSSLHAEGSLNTVYHIALGNNGYSDYTLEYSACNNHARPGAPSMVDVYRKLLLMTAAGVPSAKHLSRMVISSGDIDPVVAMHGTEAAVDKIGLEVAPGGQRRPWFYNATGAPIGVLASKPPGWDQSLHAQP